MVRLGLGVWVNRYWVRVWKRTRCFAVVHVLPALLAPLNPERTDICL